jgi:hypothetical protein
MRRLSATRLAAGTVAALLVAAAGCKPRDKIRTVATEEAPAQLASVVQMADPDATVQLLRGFHPIEGNSWRWTMGKFAVTLRPPATAAQRGATLKARFSLPEAVTAKVGAVTLSASVNGTPLQAERYERAGEHTYSRDVPASALAAEAVTCDFALDKFLPPGSVDQRELGLVMSSIGLEAK